MKIGYARVSTSEQTVDPQTDALQEAGCEILFSEVASGAETQRPGLEKAVSSCRKGDILVVWKLARMGRSMSHLIKMIQQLEENGQNLIGGQKLIG